MDNPSETEHCSTGSRRPLQFSLRRLFVVVALAAGALGFVLAAIDIETRFTVIVVNDSDRAIESFVITGPGVRAEMGPIPSGDQARTYLRFHGDGSLDFLARQQKSELSGRLEEYVTSGLRGSKTIRVKPGQVYDLETDS